MTINVEKFQALGDYTYPEWPTRTYVKRLYSRILQVFNSGQEQDFISDDELTKADKGFISEIVTLPSYGGLMKELDISIEDWLSDKSFQNKLIILPPGDDNLIQTWANNHKLFVLPEPSRESLISESVACKVDIPTDKGLVVIPRLERWFLRHHNGLEIVQELLQKMQTSEVKCLVGCNSWAHQFLQKAINSHYILPNGLMFAPYNVSRLDAWFKQMVTSSNCHHLRFKSTKSGKDIFEKNEKDEYRDSYLKELSAHSLGIPWIAWELWQKSLNSKNEENSDNSNDDETTLWLAALAEFSLPSTNDQIALLALHALLLHTELSYQEFSIVLPAIEKTNVIYLLINSGFITQKENDTLVCNMAAYPSIRAGLASAGFPMDEL